MKQKVIKIIRWIFNVAMILFSSLATAEWTSENELAWDNDTAGLFKYYVLSLSWSPESQQSPGYPFEKIRIMFEQSGKEFFDIP